MRNVLHRSLSFVVIVALVFSLMAVFATETAHAAELRKTTIVLTKKGETYQQKLILPSGKAVKSSKVEWESENNKIAKISSTGKITAVSKGTVKMTGKYNRTTFSFRVVVNDAYFKYQQFYVRGIGARKTLTLYTAANKKIPASKIKWSSTDSDVAKVSSKGVVTGVSSGNATIKAKYKGRTYSCIVYVWNGVSISVTSNTVSVSEDGTEISLKAGDETEVPLSILKNCGNTVRFNIIEGEGVVSLKLTDMSYPEGSDWYDETLEIKALKAGTATIKVYTADTEGPSDIEKNCAYLRVTVRENTPSSGGTVTPGGNQGGATPGGSQGGTGSSSLSCRNTLPYVCILNNATFRVESISIDTHVGMTYRTVTMEGVCVSILSNATKCTVQVPFRVYDATGTITDTGFFFADSLQEGDRVRVDTVVELSGPGPHTIELYGDVELNGNQPGDNNQPGGTTPDDNQQGTTPGGNVQGGTTPGGSQGGTGSSSLSCRNTLPYVCILNNATFRVESISIDTHVGMTYRTVTMEGVCVSILSNAAKCTVQVPFRVYDAAGTITDTGFFFADSLQEGDRVRVDTIVELSGPGPHTIEFYGDVQL